jgi:formylglycine-generating enzyme required for sulfatase activity
VVPAGTYRVVRGGSFRDSFSGVRTTMRYVSVTSYEYTVGFRCARDVPEPPDAGVDGG